MIQHDDYPANGQMYIKIHKLMDCICVEGNGTYSDFYVKLKINKKDIIH